MKEPIKIKPIAKLIKALKVGQSESWPIVQLTSVRITVNRIKLQYQRRFSTSTSGKHIIVTRLPDEKPNTKRKYRSPKV